MEITECTKIIHDRINEFDPENVIKIIGYLLLTCKPDELMQLALGPDKQIFSIANEAKASLGSSPKPNVGSQLPLDHPLQSMPISPTISRPFSSPSSFRVPAWEPHLSSDVSHTHNNPFGIYRNQPDLVSLEEQLRPLNPMGPDFLSNCYYPDVQLGGVLGSRGSLRSPTGLPEYSSKPCHYFYNGHCRHGGSCRYSHSQAIPDSFYNLNLNDLVNDDYGIPPGSLEELEFEISELLKDRKGMPVSIAALPMLYIDKYGKSLQCDGYLTESQRHGKSGYSLTKLLARLRTVRLIDRPHGQHSVILAEDAAKYTAYHNDRNIPGAVLASSHQIYLTFPAESTFTDQDVLNYFKQFGPVRDVRIPRQEKRMFGFVSFLYPETVKLILDRSHPHIICGSRVLVKPYKEKSRFYDRKYPEKMELPMYYPSQGFELESDFNTGLYENSILLNKHLIAECEQAIENERMRLMEMQLASKSRSPQHFSTFGIENLNISKDNLTSFPVARNNRSPSDDKPTETGSNCIDQESGRVELPDSPFASPRLSG